MEELKSKFPFTGDETQGPCTSYANVLPLSASLSPLTFLLETGAYEVIWAVLEPTLWLKQALNLRSRCLSLPSSWEYKLHPC